MKLLAECEQAKDANRNVDHYVDRDIAEQESVNVVRPRMNQNPEWARG